MLLFAVFCLSFFVVLSFIIFVVCCILLYLLSFVIFAVCPLYRIDGGSFLCCIYGGSKSEMVIIFVNQWSIYIFMSFAAYQLEINQCNI